MSLSEQLANTTSILANVPLEHRGILFERVFESVHPQENTRRVELALALLWAARNSEMGGNLLTHILYPQAIAGDEPDVRTEALPHNEREWKVAQLAVATVVQWLATSVGTAFLQEAYRNAGGKLSCTLPDTSDYVAPRL